MADEKQDAKAKLLDHLDSSAAIFEDIFRRIGRPEWAERAAKLGEHVRKVKAEDGAPGAA